MVIPLRTVEANVARKLCGTHLAREVHGVRRQLGSHRRNELLDRGVPVRVLGQVDPLRWVAKHLEEARRCRCADGAAGRFRGFWWEARVRDWPEHAALTVGDALVVLVFVVSAVGIKPVGTVGTVAFRMR